MTRPDLTRRTATRLSSYVALILTLTNCAIFTALYFSISDEMGAHLKAHVDEVRKTLVDVEGEESDGFQELATMVAGHARMAESDEDIYLLTDEAGNRVAGNVTSLERFDGWRTIPWEELKLFGTWPPNHSSNAVTGRWTQVRGGYLFVGDGNDDIRGVQKLLLGAFLWGIGISLLCALLGGWLLGLQAQRRIGEMQHTLEAVSKGALEKRIPHRPASDDLDHVAVLINATLDRLQRLFGNLHQISVDIAHDLRTPINRMRQKLEIVRAGPDDLDAYKAATDASIAEIDHIADTFDALLRISEIEAGARKDKFVDVELKALLTNITDALEAVAEEKQHQLKPVSQNAEPLTVQGDRRLLNQMFLNILENAIVHSTAPCEIGVDLERVDGDVVVRVHDGGPGIPVEERDKVFRRLYRLEKSRTTAGNGLGLSLVAAIAELHDATVTLSENAPGLVVSVRFAKT